MNANTERQLRLIAEISSALNDTGIGWWLFGGWAMDFHAGAVTRDHSDIEIFVRLEDASRLEEILQRNQFLAPGSTHPDESQPFLKDGVEVGVFFLARDADAGWHTPGRWSDWPWLPGAFDGPWLRIGDIEAPVMSAEGLLDMKLNFASHPHGSPLREKDHADIARLRALIARHLPDG